jgi:hypothetical protein
MRYICRYLCVKTSPNRHHCFCCCCLHAIAAAAAECECQAASVVAAALPLPPTFVAVFWEELAWSTPRTSIHSPVVRRISSTWRSPFQGFEDAFQALSAAIARPGRRCASTSFGRAVAASRDCWPLLLPSWDFVVVVGLLQQLKKWWKWTGGQSAAAAAAVGSAAVVAHRREMAFSMCCCFAFATML